MEDRVITISENGAVNIPATPIQMTVHEIAELLDVLVPTIWHRNKATEPNRVVKYYSVRLCC